MHPEPSAVTSDRPRRWRRVLAIGAGVAVVPALYAAANAATGGSGSDHQAPNVQPAAASSSGTELENEHGVMVAKPHGGAPTPSVPEVTTPTVAASPTTPTVPDATVPTTPEQEVEHPVPEPGDDNGGQGEIEPGDDHGGPGPGEIEAGDDHRGPGPGEIEAGDDHRGHGG